METSASMSKPFEATLSTFFVNISVEQRGSAAPPLFDGYRKLFTNITTITLDGKHKRKITDRIRNCAARMLCFLNYQLARSPHPGEGVRYSRTDFQALFRYEYGLDTIEIAQDLLVNQGYVFSPAQICSVDRTFCWHINAHRLQQAFEQAACCSKEQNQLASHQKSTHLVLINHSIEMDHLTQTPPENVSAESVNNADTRKTGTGKEEISHDLISRSGRSEIPASSQVLHPMHMAKCEHANTEIRRCNYNRTTRTTKNKQEQQKNSSPHPSQSDGQEEKNSPSPFRQMHRAKQATNHHVAPAYPPPDAPESPELILALFDWLRGYPLPDKLLARAQDAATLLLYGDESRGQPGYSRFQIEQTALYLRDHDPAWQANYATWCATTGIPEIWSVATIIPRKWPIVLRHLLTSGAYVQLDDGTLLSQENYQAWLQQEQEIWQKQQDYNDDNSLCHHEDINEEYARIESAERGGIQADTGENEMPMPTPMANLSHPDSGTIGWTRLGIARLHADRLARALPAYFDVEVQHLSEGLYGILITNSCAQDDNITITSNQQVCDLLRVIREERTREDQSIGWSILAIAQWWLDRLTHVLPTAFRIEICAVDEERYGVKLTNSTQQTSIILHNNSQVEAVMAQYMSRQSIGKRSFFRQ
jgi:hypothetical protein